MNGATPSGPSALIAATTMPAVAPMPQLGIRPNRAGGALEQRTRGELAGKADEGQRHHEGPGLLQPARPAGAEPRDIEPRHFEILGPEEDPGEAHEMEHDECRDDPRGRPLRVPAEPGLQHALDCETAAMQRAPGDEFPPRPMPDPAEQHRYHQVAIGVEPAVPVAAERLIEIVAQPGRQRDVPALPELAQPLRPVGLVEIGRKAEADERRQRDRHVAIGAEIAIDLHRIGIDRDEEIGRTVAGRGGEHRVDETGREIVRDDHLLEEPAEDQQNRRGDRDRLGRGPGQLRQEIGGAHDGAGDQLREERHVERHVERVAAHRGVAAIDVGDVGDAVEGEKRDPDRQQDLQKRQLVLHAEQPGELVRAEHEKSRDT